MLFDSYVKLYPLSEESVSEEYEIAVAQYSAQIPHRGDILSVRLSF